MLYFELALSKEEYLTKKEIQFPRLFRNFCYKIKSNLGIIVKKKFENKTIFVIPKINKKFLGKIDKIYKLNLDKNFCISDELYYKEEFLNLIRKNNINLCNGKWIIKFLLIEILDYIFKNNEENIENKEIALLVNSNYELVLEYIKMLNGKVRNIIVVTNNIKKFSKIKEKYLNQIPIKIENNYKKSILRTDIVVNLDFEDKYLQKLIFNYKTYFINLYSKYEIKSKNFEGINITKAQIAMPIKYLKYIDLFYNFNYLNIYESFIKKNTSYKNIIEEIKKDNIEIILLENEKEIIPKKLFYVKKLLDK